jgi:hypothetical protein
VPLSHPFVERLIRLDFSHVKDSQIRLRFVAAEKALAAAEALP